MMFNDTTNYCRAEPGSAGDSSLLFIMKVKFKHEKLGRITVSSGISSLFLWSQTDSVCLQVLTIFTKVTFSSFHLSQRGATFYSPFILRKEDKVFPQSKYR